MEHSFSVTVSDITKGEYTCAVRWLSRRREILFLILAPLTVLVLALILKSTSPTIYAVPVVLLFAIAGFFEYMYSGSYKQFPKDLRMDYHFDEQGWTLQVRGDNGACKWADMTALVERKHVFLLYHTKNSSNLLPKRCLTAEQIEQIQTWYRNAK